MSDIETHIAAEEFEELYFRLRKKEGRIYTDEEVAQLPLIHRTNPHYKEWVTRKNSLKALISYIKHKDTVTSILEVGCGNGWLSAQLSKATDAEVTGLDINTHELEQARRVFKNISTLHFIKGSLQTEVLNDKKFDMILFAASVQYFSSLDQVIHTALEQLTMLGEIHIMDSPFYRHHEIDEARQRTRSYYNDLGFPGMSRHYFHHSIHELGGFQYKILHHPLSWKNKLSIKKNPFYWISIKNPYR